MYTFNKEFLWKIFQTSFEIDQYSLKLLSSLVPDIGPFSYWFKGTVNILFTHYSIYQEIINGELGIPFGSGTGPNIAWLKKEKAILKESLAPTTSDTLESPVKS